MSQFIDFEAAEEASDSEMVEECERVEERESGREFIDDADYEESVGDYYGFTNVTTPYEDTIQDALEGFDWEQEPENYTEEPTASVSIDKFKNLDERVAKFKSRSINPQRIDNPHSLFTAFFTH